MFETRELPLLALPVAHVSREKAVVHQWTSFLSSDDPEGSGDYELQQQLIARFGAVCAQRAGDQWQIDEPVGIYCHVLDQPGLNRSWAWYGQVAAQPICTRLSIFERVLTRVLCNGPLHVASLAPVRAFAFRCWHGKSNSLCSCGRICASTASLVRGSSV